MNDVAEATPPPQHLCSGWEIEERGRAWVWDVLEYGRPARAFVLRFDGELRGYMNRCLHVPTEMDWQPGEFLDTDKRWISMEAPVARALMGRRDGDDVTVRRPKGDITYTIVRIRYA